MPDTARPATVRQRNIADMTAFWAVVLVLRQLDTPKAKGEYLVAQVSHSPRILQYLQAATQTARRYKTSQELMSLTVVREPDFEPLPLLTLLRCFTVGASEEDKKRVKPTHWPMTMLTMRERPELVAAANLIYDRTMDVGITTVLLEKVAARVPFRGTEPSAPVAKQPPPAKQQPITKEPGLVFVINREKQGAQPIGDGIYARGHVLLDGGDIGCISLRRSDMTKVGMRLGVLGIKMNFKEIEE